VLICHCCNAELWLQPLSVGPAVNHNFGHGRTTGQCGQERRADKTNLRHTQPLCRRASGEIHADRVLEVEEKHSRGEGALCRQRFAEEVFQRQTGVLTQKAHVDLDPDTATRLDTDHAADDSDFIAFQRHKESDL